MTAAALDVSALSAGYGQTTILEDVSFAVPAGGRLAILGRNGMGKTTLLATIAGQTRRLAGSVRLGSQDITGLDGSARARAGLGYVPQHRAIFKSLTVEENLEAGLKSRPKGDVGQAYAMFPRLKERRKNLGGQLSGGEQQMLTTARSIMGQPSVLLLDEPLEGLAPAICEELITALGDLADSKAMTIVLVEQRLKMALAFAENVLIMERGRLAWSGLASALEREPETIDKFLGLGTLQKD